jgi:serine/threonine-protein kinase HipA
MARHKTYPPLRVYQNNQFVGTFSKQPSGALEFKYDNTWLNTPDAYPVSLSLPLREDAFKGEPVAAVFENLLPDSDTLRNRVAEKVGAAGNDAYSLLMQIGRDCVGALQFVRDGAELKDTSEIKGEVVDDEKIEKILNNLARSPLGLDQEDDFRISVAGAQEKTALLFHEGQWLRPYGTTPTTHILKTQIGALPNGIDLSDSVENEFYGLAIMAAFGLPANKAEIKTFGRTKSLVIERFDRTWTKEGRLLRIPQEDCCQALSAPPSRKYQNQGGPSMVDILNLLKGSDTPAADQKTFLKAQILFWLMGATDGHAKNFSIFLGAGGRFHLTPMYDVLTVLPYCASRQIESKKIKMAMSVGGNNHYRMSEIQGRHFMQTAEKAGIPAYIAKEALGEIADTAEDAFKTVEKILPKDFPEDIHRIVRDAFLNLLRS